MKFYQMKFGLEEYDDLTSDSSITFDLIQSFDGRKHLPEWKPIKVIRMNPEFQQPLSDAPNFVFPVFSENALKCLLPLIKDDIEILDLDFFDKQNYYGINIIDVLDAIDYDKSEYIKFVNSNKIMVFNKYYFIRNVVEKKHIFKIIDEPKRYAFVSEQFKNEVEKNRLTGFIFDLVCDI